MSSYKAQPDYVTKSIIIAVLLGAILAACKTSTNNTYERPVIKKDDLVLVRIPGSMDFKAAKVCAVKSSDNVTNPSDLVCLRMSEEKLRNLKEGEVLVGGCFGLSGMQSSAAVKIDDVVPVPEFGETKSTPRVDEGDIVITQGSEDSNIVAHQCSPPTDLFKHWFVPVKVVTADKNLLQFKFLSDDGKSLNISSFIESPGSDGVYNTFNGWYVLNPTLKQSLVSAK